LDYNVLHRVLTKTVVVVMMNTMLPADPHFYKLYCNISYKIDNVKGGD